MSEPGVVGHPEGHDPDISLSRQAFGPAEELLAVSEVGDDDAPRAAASDQRDRVADQPQLLIQRPIHVPVGGRSVRHSHDPSLDPAPKRQLLSFDRNA